MSKRHPANAAGDWFVDTRCTNCGAARHVATGLIVEREGQSVFARQPKTREEIVMAWRARLLCPTASVHTEKHQDVPEGVFPQRLTENVYRLGYNTASSYGAHSYLIRRKSGNAMVDSPRWTKAVVNHLETWGGLSDILLSHRDDVADAARYAKHFGARVFIHRADKAGARFADQILDGEKPAEIYPDLLAIPIPGHTKGSVAYLYDGRCLFSGDSLAWNLDKADLVAYRDYCWYSWDEQIKSLRRLADIPFAWVLPGHGADKELPPKDMRTRLLRLLERMERES
jgi:glyoxylase-like metal-dependent hydrolase (beta-lactamase superfamily II)